MSIFAGDAIIKAAVELGLDDLRKNPWLVEDIFSDFIENPILAQKYGMKEIQNAKDFLMNNKIHIFMSHRLDKEEFPAITIALGDSSEDKSLATLGDQSADIEDMDAEDIGRPIQYIVKPFEIVNYNQAAGVITIPSDPNFKYINEGMLLVESSTGNAWVIRGKKSGNRVIIDAGTELDGDKFGIAPKYQLYRARRERIISQETYNIGCHVHGDPSTLLFLFGFVKYCLLRYREGLLEANNFQLSNLSCTDLIKNSAFQAENVYSRFITLSGQTEESWIKTPYRIIEAVGIQEGDATGITILSNKDTDSDSDESENDLWDTMDDES
jgi:hypothetical protein